MSNFEFNPSPEQDPHSGESQEPEVTLSQVHQEFVASAAETRRGNRRTLEVLKNFGTVLDALSGTVNDTHKAIRSLPATTSSGPPDEGELPKSWALTLLELADRIARIEGSFEHPPAPERSWWPGSDKATQRWREAWERQSGALHILATHMEGLFSRAGLERIPTLDEPFDPATMNAVESETNANKPDHSVLAEILPGWRHSASGDIVRPAQVRVSRLPTS